MINQDGWEVPKEPRTLQPHMPEVFSVGRRRAGDACEVKGGREIWSNRCLCLGPQGDREGTQEAGDHDGQEAD